MPVVIEIVDTKELIEAFSAVAGEMLERAECGGLITEERAHIIRYSHGVAR